MTQATISKPALFAHQEQAVDFILQKNGIAALYMDMGTGKTRTVIEAFECLRKIDPALKMIVIAPLSLLRAAWQEDVRKFSNFSCFNTHEERLPKLLREDIMVINYEAAILEKNKWLFTLIRNNLLVIDESSRLKSHNTKTTKTILQLGTLARYRLVMSGTPAPNSPVEYWAQMQFLYPGIFHPSFYAFRNTYFHLARGNQKMQMHGQMIDRKTMREIMSKGWKYEITAENMKKLMLRMSPYVFWAKKEDCLDLPEQVDEVRQVELSTEQKKHYKQMERDLITEIKGQAITAQVALAKLMKLREISSGFLLDVLQQPHEIPGPCPKLIELEHVIDEAGDQPIIIWACFKYDIEKIEDFLAEKYGQESVVTLYSQTADTNDSIVKFQSGWSRFLVANPQSAAHGLTFVNCSLQVFYSLDYSYERYEQAKARIHRAGQTKKCTYVHLIARGTIDEKILKVLKEKGDMETLAWEIMR